MHLNNLIILVTAIKVKSKFFQFNRVDWQKSFIDRPFIDRTEYYNLS